ncbi:hypothetical protein [Streptacidiphilus carbonis]|uniref:hypothetical protein n=1 Tax=Streptacidiphilus carbonis TaxID=105422 RepID=UPI0005A8F2C0|nr:hypothetical protein [Streptacidiphilus carbonis]
MTTSVTTSLPLWLTGCTYDANGGNDLRNSGVSAYFYDQGIVTGTSIGLLAGVVGGAGLQATAGTGMTVLVQPGSFVVPNSATPTAGGYASTLSTQATLTVQTADPSNPRIDIVVANVVDNGNSTSFGQVQILTGTAAPSPSAPGAPANSLILAQLSVPAGTSSMTGGLVTDKRSFTTTTGGVLVAPKGSATGYVGQVAYDGASGSFYHNTNVGGAQQLKVLPWPPQTLFKTSPTISTSGSVVTVLSTTITVDGSTDISIYVKATGLAMLASHGEFGANLQAMVDGSLIDQMVVLNTASDGVVRGGGSFTAYTSASQGTTPSAGTHTVSFKLQGIDSSGVQVTLYASSGSPSVMRVSPVVL